MPAFKGFLVRSLGRMKPALCCDTGAHSHGSYCADSGEGYFGKTKEMKKCFDSFAKRGASGWRDLVFSCWLSGVDIPLL